MRGFTYMYVPVTYGAYEKSVLDQAGTSARTYLLLDKDLTLRHQVVMHIECGNKHYDLIKDASC
jgi:hypothetical protein